MLKDRHLIVPDGGLLKGLRIESEIENSCTQLCFCFSSPPSIPITGVLKIKNYRVPKEVKKC